MEINNENVDMDIDLMELWRTLIRHWYCVLGIPLLLMAFVFVKYSRMPRVWEANAVFQVGRIRNNLIEPVAQIIARAETQQFKTAGFNSLNMPGIQSGQAGLYADSLKIRQLRGTDLLELKVRGFSREEAICLAEGTIKYLKKLHNNVMEPAIAFLQRQLTDAKEDAAKTRKSLEKLAESMQSKNIKTEDSYFRTMFSASLGQQLGADLRNLRQKKLELEEQISPSQTHPTFMVNNVYAADEPVSVRRFANTLVAGMVGLFMGVLVAFLLGVIKKYNPGTSAGKKKEA
ncbi:MAG: hypothetical protein ABIG11_02585 [bacterium]